MCDADMASCRFSWAACRVACAIIALGALLGSSASAEAIRAQSSHFALGEKDKFSALVGQRFLARCRMDWCHWVSLMKVRRVGKSKNGELYHVLSHWWTSGPHKPSYKYPA